MRPPPGSREPELSSVLCGSASGSRAQDHGSVWGAQGRRARFTWMRQSGEQYKTGVIHPLYITANRGCGRGRRVSRSNVRQNRIAQQLCTSVVEGGGGARGGGERGRGRERGHGGSGAGRARGGAREEPARDPKSRLGRKPKPAGAAVDSSRASSQRRRHRRVPRLDDQTEKRWQEIAGLGRQTERQLQTRYMIWEAPQTNLGIERLEGEA